MKRNALFICFLFFYVTVLKADTLPFRISAGTAAFIKDAVYSPRYNTVFFFSGSSMMLYNLAAAQTVQPAWYPLRQPGNIDASLLWDDNHLLLFYGASYVMYEIDSARIISSLVLWPNLPADWKGKLDAAVRWSDNEIMFFSGSQYLLYNISGKAYKELNNFTRWEGWPVKWTSDLQAVLNINKTIYFLENGEFISVDPVTQKLSAPAPIWKPD